MDGMEYMTKGVSTAEGGRGHVLSGPAKFKLSLKIVLIYNSCSITPWHYDLYLVDISSPFI